VDHANVALKNELTMINQTFLHARMLDNWGIQRMGERIYSRSIRAMKDADEIVERVLFLESLPAMQELGKIWIGQNVQEILDCEMKLEMACLETLRSAITMCEEQRDFISRDDLTDILEHHEDYIDWLEAQLYQIENMGLENYIQLMAGAKED
jgi:bacterioferritin